jgi:hypothetical protein
MVEGGDGREDILLAVPASKMVLAETLFSLLVLLELLASSSTSLCCLKPECSCMLGRRLAARLCALLAATLWLFVPPGENVPLRANEVRRSADENASARLNAWREAWCSGSTLPRYFDLGISLGL